MKKQDFVIFFVLILLLIFWPNIYRTFIGEKEGRSTHPAAAGQAADVPEAPVGAMAEPALETAQAPALSVPEPAAASVAEPVPAQPESTIDIANDAMVLTVSSLGGVIRQAVLKEYRAELAEDSDPVVLDFDRRPALACEGLPGFTAKDSVSLTTGPDGRSAMLEGVMTGGIQVRREIQLVDDYMIRVREVFTNPSGQPVELPDHRLFTGNMVSDKAHPDMHGLVSLGADSLPGAGGIQHWSKKIQKQFERDREDRGLPALAESVLWPASAKPMDWVATKNKFFAQILMPTQAEGEGVYVQAWRNVPGTEKMGGPAPRKAMVEQVAAGIGFEGRVLAAGEVYSRDLEFYIGPKSYQRLSALSHSRDAVMGFDENAFADFIVVPTAKILLRTLNFLHDLIPNYGVAILLLTIIIKVIFWPITHKSTESMRKLGELQPMMKEIREKHKDNPQKQSAEMMALYKKHKVNPLGGCIPMLVQFPVLIGLFVVLRIAIELRFSSFLWISDLSAPERIMEFGFAIPLLGWDALNILPILMSLSMYVQMQLTPAGGDPQQQKIMRIMMPAMMLFFLYNFASGLALYWTMQNVLMIFQQLVYKYRKEHGMIHAKA